MSTPSSAIPSSVRNGFILTAKERLAAVDVYAGLQIINCNGVETDFNRGFYLSTAYRSITGWLGRNAISRQGLVVARSAILESAACEADYRRPPGLAGGAMPLWYQGELAGAVGFVATTEFGLAPNGREVGQIIRQVANETSLGPIDQKALLTTA